MKRAALYMRVSTVDQHPETQLHDLRLMAGQRGYEIVHEYTAISAIPSVSAQPGWLNEWALILPMVHALRAGRLRAVQIIEYRQALQQLAARYPTQADVWNELLLVAISFEKNPVLALSLVTEALQHIPGSEDLARMRNIIQMWARERRHGSH